MGFFVCVIVFFFRASNSFKNSDALLLDMKTLATLHFPDISVDSDFGGFQDLLEYNEMTVEDVMRQVSF